MSKDPQSRLKDVISGHESAARTAAVSDIVNFQDWLFFGTEPNVFVQVGITPASQSISIEYAVVVLQTPQGLVFSNASVNTSNAQAGWTLNLATDTALYNISQLGDQVQAWAFAQAYIGGQLQSQYSDTLTYTVNS